MTRPPSLRGERCAPQGDHLSPAVRGASAADLADTSRQAAASFAREPGVGLAGLRAVADRIVDQAHAVELQPVALAVIVRRTIGVRESEHHE
jgi:hypothetical protein